MVCRDRFISKFNIILIDWSAKELWGVFRINPHLQALYEEMEQQIQRERKAIRAEEEQREKRTRKELEAVLEMRDTQVNGLLEKQKKLQVSNGYLCEVVHKC